MSIDDQSRTPGRTTLQEAVNTLLSNIGEAPVATLEDEQVVEARLALRTLLETHKEAQTRGWGWNTEEGVSYQVATDHTLTVPENVVRWSLNRYRYDTRFVLRGQKVYDRETRSYVLGDDVTHVVADVVKLLPWDSCPEAFNRYATIRAARTFAARLVTDDSLFRYSATDEQLALAELERMESEEQQPNILHDSAGMYPVPTYNPAAGMLRNAWGHGISRLGF